MTTILADASLPMAQLGLREAPASGGFDLSSKTPDPANVTGFVIVLVLLGLLAATLWLIRRYLVWRETPAPQSDRALFRELCRVHRLTRNDRQVLVSMARAMDLHPPARLFLEPQSFDEFHQLPAAAKRRQAAQELKARLFGVGADKGSTGA